MESSSPHPAALSETTLLAACRQERLRRSGPGGQHRNKVETAVRLTHEPTGIVAEASERRSQAQNRRVAVRRLRIRLALEVRQSPPPSPPDIWSSRITGERIVISVDHDDFPALLAYALDVLAEHNWDRGDSAKRLGLSGSALVRFLKLEPQAFALMNNYRREAGLSPLR